MAFITRVLVVSLAVGAAGLSVDRAAIGDTLLVDTVNAAQASTADRPGRGSSMASVEARFGAPSARSNAIGQPPITRWEYPDFVVFFEFDHVVHSVRR